MAGFFRQPDRRQRYLLPVDMMDWLPDGDIVHLVVDAVELMDVSKFEAAHRVGGAGQAPFAPKVLLALLIYAYSQGVRSSRKIERLCERDAGYRFIVGAEVPDHTVIARFRRRHSARMAAVFRHVLAMCKEAGLVRLGVVALDGTKVQANAALDANRTAESIDAQIKRMMDDAEATDQQEDELYGAQRGDEVPEGLQRREDRLNRLKACKDRVTREAEARAKRQQDKLDARAAEEQATGKRKRGRKPKAPDASVDESAVANPTDPDSRIMKTRRGWVQGYNAQAAVTQDQIILAADVTDQANDVQQLDGMLAQAEANAAATLGPASSLGAVVADAGYWSESNAKAERPGRELFIATQKDHKQRAELRDAPPPRGRIPKNLSPRERMDRKLRTKRGRAIYRQRGQTVEPVFGHMKGGQGADRFSMRGLEACRGEWQLDAAVYNLRKLHRESVRSAKKAGEKAETRPR
jgi:transposase